MENRSSSLSVPHPEDAYQNIVIEDLAAENAHLRAELRHETRTRKDAYEMCCHANVERDRLRARVLDLTVQLKDLRHELDMRQRLECAS